MPVRADADDELPVEVVEPFPGPVAFEFRDPPVLRGHVPFGHLEVDPRSFEFGFHGLEGGAVYGLDFAGVVVDADEPEVGACRFGAHRQTLLLELMRRSPGAP